MLNSHLNKTDVIYSEIPTTKMDYEAYYFYTVEGGILMLLNIPIAIVILITPNLRCQKEFVIFAFCMLFDAIFGFTYFYAGIFRLIIYYTEMCKYIIILKSGWMFSLYHFFHTVRCLYMYLNWDVPTVLYIYDNSFKNFKLYSIFIVFYPRFSEKKNTFDLLKNYRLCRRALTCFHLIKNANPR